MKNKLFRVAAVSSNANSFGLTGIVLMARDGQAWEVGRVQFGQNTPWKTGMEIPVSVDENDRPLWHYMGVEIPRQLSTAPLKIARFAWRKDRFTPGGAK